MLGPAEGEWRPDPWSDAAGGGKQSLRWWNGHHWTDSIRTWSGDAWIDGVQAHQSDDTRPVDSEFRANTGQGKVPEAFDQSESLGACPSCGRPVQGKDWRICPQCGEALAVTRHQPGEIVNGYILGSDHQWHPTPTPPPAAAPKAYAQSNLVIGMGAAGFLAGLVIPFIGVALGVVTLILASTDSKRRAAAGAEPSSVGYIIGALAVLVSVLVALIWSVL